MFLLLLIGDPRGNWSRQGEKWRKRREERQNRGGVSPTSKPPGQQPSVPAAGTTSWGTPDAQDLHPEMPRVPLTWDAAWTSSGVFKSPQRFSCVAGTE